MSFHPKDYDHAPDRNGYAHHQTGTVIHYEMWKNLVPSFSVDEMRRADDARANRAAQRLAKSHAARLMRIAEAADFEVTSLTAWDEVVDHVVERLKGQK